MNGKLWLTAALCLSLGTAGFLATSEAQPPKAEQPAPVTKESSAAFRKVVKQTLPAVVSIKTDVRPKQDGEKKGRRIPRDFRFKGDNPEEFRRQLEELFGGEMEDAPAPR